MYFLSIIACFALLSLTRQAQAMETQEQKDAFAKALAGDIKQALEKLMGESLPPMVEDEPPKKLYVAPEIDPDDIERVHKIYRNNTLEKQFEAKLLNGDIITACWFKKCKARQNDEYECYRITRDADGQFFIAPLDKNYFDILKARYESGYLRGCKIDQNLVLKQYIIEQLRSGYSPNKIANDWNKGHKDQNISSKSIHRFAHREENNHLELWKFFRQAHSKRRQKQNND